MNKYPFLKVWSAPVALLAVVVVALVSDLAWVHQHPLFTDPDSAYHLSQGAAFRAVLRSPGNLFEKLITLWTWPGLYPPAVYLVSWAWNLLEPPSVAASLGSFAVFIAVAAWGGFTLGRQMGGALLGLAAACLVLADPTLLHTQKSYWPDMPLAAVVLATLAVLVMTRQFRDPLPSVVCGLLLGLGMLTKPNFIWYLALPVAWAAVGALRGARPSRGELNALGTVLALWGGLYFLVGHWVLAHNNLFASLGSAGDAAHVARVKLLCQDQMFTCVSDTLTPPLSYLVAVGWTVLGIAWWVWTARSLRGPLANLSRCLCAASLLAGPWFLVNQWFLSLRWQPIVQDIPTRLGHLPEGMGAFVHALCLPVLLLAIGGMAAPWLHPSRRAAVVPVLLALGGGLLATLIFLPPTDRYTAPLSVLVAVLAVAALPTGRGVPQMIVAAAALYCGFNLFGAAIFERVPAAMQKTCWAVSEVTRLAVADSGLADAGHLEEVARQGLLHLAPSEASLCVVAPQTMTDEAKHLWYLLVARSYWEGRVVAIRAVQSDSAEEIEQDPTMFAQLYTLARRGGGRSAQDMLDLAPQLVVMPRALDAPARLAGSLFGGAYETIEAPTSSYVLLHRQGAGNGL